MQRTILLQQSAWIRVGATALLLTIATLLMAAPLVAAEKPADTRALAGVKQGKVIWDVTVGEPKKLLMLLGVIEETYDDLVRQGVKPDMVFAFHGPVLKLLTTERDGLTLDEELAHDEVAEKIRDLQQRPGVHMEGCSIAARLLNVDIKTLLPGIEPVGNTFVSQIGYQAKGYAFIPIY